MNATKELDKWVRKYYTAKIQFCSANYPGDGWHIELSNGKRKVILEDLDMPEETSLDDRILEAIKRWHADSSLKKYYGLIHFNKDQSSIVPSSFKEDSTESEMQVDRSDFSEQWGGGVLRFHFYARNENEAIAKIAEICPNHQIHCWEK